MHRRWVFPTGRSIPVILSIIISTDGWPPIYSWNTTYSHFLYNRVLSPEPIRYISMWRIWDLHRFCRRCRERLLYRLSCLRPLRPIFRVVIRWSEGRYVSIRPDMTASGWGTWLFPSIIGNFRLRLWRWTLFSMWIRRGLCLFPLGTIPIRCRHFLLTQQCRYRLSLCLWQMLFYPMTWLGLKAFCVEMFRLRGM